MRAALYIDCDSIEAKAVPVIYEDIIRTDKLVICKMFNSDKDDDSFMESAGGSEYRTACTESIRCHRRWLRWPWRLWRMLRFQSQSAYI